MLNTEVPCATNLIVLLEVLAATLSALAPNFLEPEEIPSATNLLIWFNVPWAEVAKRSTKLALLLASSINV